MSYCVSMVLMDRWWVSVGYYQAVGRVLAILKKSLNYSQEEKWYSAALKEEVEKVTQEKNELQQKCKQHEKVNHNIEHNINLIQDMFIVIFYSVTLRFNPF